MQRFFFKDWENQECSVRQTEGKKNVYAHGHEIGLQGEEAACPLQPDETRFQRKKCMEPTNENIKELSEKFKQQAQSTDSNMAKFVLPQSPYENQPARYYLDTNTDDCFYCHEGGKRKTNGKFWGYKKFSDKEIQSYKLKALKEGTWKVPSQDGSTD